MSDAPQKKRLRRIAGGLSRAVTRIEELCLAWGILGIAVLTIGNVISRSVFGESIFFAEEVSQFLIVIVTFLGLGYAAGEGRHIRMTAFYDQIPDRGRKALRMLISATTALLLFYLAYLGFVYCLGTMRQLGSLSPVLRVPQWIVFLAAPIGFILAGIQYVLGFVKNMTTTEDVYLSFTKTDAPEEPSEIAEGPSPGI